MSIDVSVPLNSYSQGNGLISGGDGGQGIFDTSTTQIYPLGTRRRLEDGRVFYYAHFVAAANRGTVVSQDVSVSAVAPIDGKAAAAATGQNQVTLTDTDTFSTADAADVYAGGYLHAEDDAGEGYNYRIKTNTQGTAAGVVVLTLFDNIETALTTASDLAITGSMHKNLRPASTTDPLISGVANVTMAAGEYGWVQTWGPATVLCDESGSATVAAGTVATLSDGVAGAAQRLGGADFATNSLNSTMTTDPLVGYFLYAGTDAAHVGIYLQITP